MLKFGADKKKVIDGRRQWSVPIPSPHHSSVHSELFHGAHFVLKVSEFTTGTQRAVCNGFASFSISLAALSKKRGCGNKRYNTLHCASEVVSVHIYWVFRALENQ